MLRKNKVFNFDYINLENKSESLEKNRIKTIKTIDQSEKNSSLIVGKNVTINGSIKAGNEVLSVLMIIFCPIKFINYFFFHIYKIKI